MREVGAEAPFRHGLLQALGRGHEPLFERQVGASLGLRLLLLAGPAFGRRLGASSPRP